MNVIIRFRTTTIVTLIATGILAFGFATTSHVSASEEDSWTELGGGGYGTSDIFPESYGTSDIFPEYYGTTDIFPEYYGTSDIFPEYYGTSDIFPESYGTADIFPESYGSADIFPNSYGSADIFPDSYGSADIFPNSYGSVDIFPNSYGSADIYPMEFAVYEKSGGYMYSDGYFATPRYHAQPMTITPPSYRPTPSYPTPSYPTPSYPAPRPTPTPSYPVPSPSVTNTNINTNTNTCVNNSCNTNINNSGNTTVTTVAIATPQPLVQYQFQNLSCTITVGQSSIQNGNPAWLSWTSIGATQASLSDGIGRVALNGTLAVRPDASRNYVLTVWGVNGQSASCNVTVNVTGSAPYVSLSQIPYTGLDLGLVGNIVYWMSLIAFAVAGAYLALYYVPAHAGKGGMRALVGSMIPTRSRNGAVSEIVEEEVTVGTPIDVAPVTVVAPKAILASLPVMESRSTKDSMTIGRTHTGAPMIVINRA